VGIYLNGSRSSEATGTDFATLRKCGLERFRAAGKTILAYNMNWNETLLEFSGKYHCAQPLGEMEIDGMSAQPLFLTGALEKYGIGVQVIQVGKFKAAVEPFC